MARRKQLAIVVLPAAATTMALATGSGTASANTTTRSHTYFDSGGDPHTCTINLTRTVPFNSDPQVGQGGTSTSGGTDCTSGVIAFISASWNDPDGNPISTAENDDESSAVLRRYAPIGSSFVTHHRVDFTGAPEGCSSGCLFTANRSK